MSATDDNLNIVKSWQRVTSPANNQAVTPHAPTRTVAIAANCQYDNQASLLNPPGVNCQISPNGVDWETVYRCYFDVGSVTLSLLGVHVLGVVGTSFRTANFWVPPGYQYRFSEQQPFGAGTLQIDWVQEWAMEVDAHNSVQFRVEGLDPADAPPTDAIRLPCDWPCWSPSLFIDQYERDAGEGYRDFEAGDPAKGYVRAAENTGAAGGPFQANLTIINPQADNGLTGWSSPDGSTWATNNQTGDLANKTRWPAVGGSDGWYFYPTDNNVDFSKLQQTISLENYASAIAANGGTLNLAARQNCGYSVQNSDDDGRIGVQFLDGNQSPIGAATFGATRGLTPGAATQWGDITHTAAIPTNARYATIMLEDRTPPGNASHCYFDRVSATADLDGTGTTSNENNLHVTGRKADEGAGDSFELEWRGTVYTVGDPEVSFPSSTTWLFQGDPGAEVGPPGEMLTVRQTGQPDAEVEICVDRTLPVASLAFTDMVFGTDAGTPMRRGEYARLLANYSDAGVGVESAALAYATPGHWVSPPLTLDDGVASGYFRSSSSAPLSGGSDITLTVTDKAGNVASDTVTAHFEALPAAPAVSLSNLSTNIRPAHLNQSEYAQTAYDDNTVGATVNIAPAVEDCRNAALDDTRSQLVSGSLSINTSSINDVDGQAAVVHSTNVPSQSSKLDGTIKGRVLDQHYRTTYSAEVGDYAFNVSRANDFGVDQTVGIGAPPYTGKAVEPFTDENAGASLSDCDIFDGAVRWLGNGAVLEVTLNLPSNGGQLYRPRLFDKSGNELLHSTYGGQIAVALHDGAAFVDSGAADDFGPDAQFDIAARNSAASIAVRITVSDQSVPALGAFVMNYQAV